MEAREPSSSVSTGAGGSDGPANEEGLLSEAGRLAKEAAVLFQNRRFSECIDILNQLLQKKGDDPKVLHNIAVTEYFHDGCSDPRKLLDVFDMVKKRSEDLARASVERMEVGSNMSSNTALGSKVNSTMLPQLSAPNTGNIIYADDYDTSVVVRNIAVILYHLHEYAHALSVLEPLYQNIEPIDEATALHVCLLLLDVALACQDASKAADVIQYLDKSFGVRHMINQVDNGSIAQHQSNQGSKVSTTSNTTGPDASGSDSSGSANVSENALARTLSDDALEYETLYSTLDTGTLGRPASNDCSNSSADRAASAIDLKLNLHLYKVRLLLLTRNLKAAKREVKLAMNVARCRDSSTALLLKAQLEYARGNHRKAIKLLMTSSNRTEAGMLSMFNNNLGCIYHQLGKLNISTLSFCRALKSSMLLHPEKPLKLPIFSQDKSLVILYNCGLQYLACGKPLVAARCFNKARSIFFNRPLLWLRFAECCLSALEKGLDQPSGASSSGDDEVKVHVVGTGRWRQLVIDEKNLKCRCSDGPGEDGAISPDGQIRLSLPFARQCLLNALHLLNNFELTKSGASNSKKEDGGDQELCFGAKNSSHRNALSGDSKASNATSASATAGANGDSKEVKGGTSSSSNLQSSVAAYEDTCKKLTNLIKQAVLGDLAYVELSLENPLKALAAATALQHLPECSRVYNFLSHVYAAEALCHLNQPKEAAEHLSIYISDKNEVQFPYVDEDRHVLRIEKGGEGEELNCHLNAKTSLEEPQGIVFPKPEEARGVLYVNLATMSIMQGNHEQASRFVKEALSALPNNPRATLAAIYVDLLLGRIKDALVKLKQSRHVRFLPSGVKLRSTC